LLTRTAIVQGGLTRRRQVASVRRFLISSSLAPSNTGVAIGTPFFRCCKLDDFGIAHALDVFLLPPFSL